MVATNAESSVDNNVNYHPTYTISLPFKHMNRSFYKSSGILHPVVWYKLSDVSRALTASIIKIMP
jgi:hypothetical protein